jgi:hypothetical protein
MHHGRATVTDPPQRCLLALKSLLPDAMMATRPERACRRGAGGAVVFYLGQVCLLYLDPGTGSLIIQGLIALFAGAAVTIRLYWKRIKSVFGGPRPDERADDETPPPSVDA